MVESGELSVTAAYIYEKMCIRELGAARAHEVEEVGGVRGTRAHVASLLCRTPANRKRDTHMRATLDEPSQPSRLRLTACFSNQ